MWIFLFDFDGTLAELNIRKIRPELVQDLEEYYKQHGYNIKITRITRSIERGPKELRQGAYEILKSYELMQAEKARVYPYARETLKWAKQNGKVAIVSLNSKECILKVLKRYSLLPFIDLIVSRDDVNAIKPSPETIFYAIKKLQGIKDKTVMIGDSDTDANAAMNAGIKCIIILRDKNKLDNIMEFKPYKIVENLKEAKEILKKLAAPSSKNKN